MGIANTVETRYVCSRLEGQVVITQSRMKGIWIMPTTKAGALKESGHVTWVSPVGPKLQLLALYLLGLPSISTKCLTSYSVLLECVC